MNNIIETRKKIYRDFPKENLEVSLNDIVLAYKINDDDYNQLVNNIKIGSKSILLLSWDSSNFPNLDEDPIFNYIILFFKKVNNPRFVLFHITSPLFKLLYSSYS